MRHTWRPIVKRLDVALTTSLVIGPVIVWLVTGSISTLGVIYAVGRSLGLPEWSASESYISRLRRWRTDRRRPSGDPPASLPS
jgi:hypothetical protein